MKNFLIFIAIATVIVFAAMYATQRMNELNEIAIKTPAQVEMKNDLIKREPQQNKNNSPQNNIQTPANSFNERLKEQQNNNLPQTKQPNFKMN